MNQKQLDHLNDMIGEERKYGEPDLNASQEDWALVGKVAIGMTLLGIIIGLISKLTGGSGGGGGGGSGGGETFRTVITRHEVQDLAQQQREYDENLSEIEAEIAHQRALLAEAEREEERKKQHQDAEDKKNEAFENSLRVELTTLKRSAEMSSIVRCLNTFGYNRQGVISEILNNPDKTAIDMMDVLSSDLRRQNSNMFYNPKSTPLGLRYRFLIDKSIGIGSVTNILSKIQSITMSVENYIEIYRGALSNAPHHLDSAESIARRSKPPENIYAPIAKVLGLDVDSNHATINAKVKEWLNAVPPDELDRIQNKRTIYEVLSGDYGALLEAYDMASASVIEIKAALIKIQSFMEENPPDGSEWQRKVNADFKQTRLDPLNTVLMIVTALDHDFKHIAVAYNDCYTKYQRLTEDVKKLTRQLYNIRDKQRGN